MNVNNSVDRKKRGSVRGKIESNRESPMEMMSNK